MRSGRHQVAVLAAVTTLAVGAAACGGSQQQGPPSATARSPTTEAAEPTASTKTTAGSNTDTSHNRPTDDGRVLTPGDDGAEPRLRVGDVAELHVPDSFAPEPQVEGDAIEIVETVSVAGSEGREWEIRAVRPGNAILTGSNEGEKFSFIFRVRE